jgi:hypothetical protein
VQTLAIAFLDLEKRADGTPLFVNALHVQSLAPSDDDGTILAFASGASENLWIESNAIDEDALLSPEQRQLDQDH